MTRRPNRPRRPASPAKLRALRAMGWRYSSTREAWVHRAFNGRMGPVFIDPDYYNHPGVTEAVHFEAVRPFRAPEVVMAEGDRPALPQRRRRPVVPKDQSRVKVRLPETEEARVVVVDGKPPQRGVDPASLSTTDAVVVPIKSARATG